MTLDIQEAVDQGYITPAADIKLTPEKEADFKDGLIIDPAKPEMIVRGHSVVRRDLISERAD